MEQVVSRRGFLETLGGAVCVGALTGSVQPPCRRENAALAAAMRDYTAKGLYGGIVCTSNRGDLRAAGKLTLAPDSPAMPTDARFDLASIGKTHTAALCALLYAEGKLDPDAPFTDYMPEHVLAKEHCRITVRDLATHSGGFDNSKPYMSPDEAKIQSGIRGKRPVRPRGVKFEYACSNFLYMGLIVEHLTGLSLDAAAKKMLWGPLGMKDTTWNTIVGDPKAVEYAPSTYGGKPSRRIGEHNDLCCHYYAPRNAGNGSDFSTAPDMLRFCEDLLHRERFAPAYYDLLFTPSFDKDGVRRSFGWDMRTNPGFSAWKGTCFSSRAIAHSGWTGGMIIVDPERDFAGVMLGNQCAGKEKTMGPRAHLLDLMARDT